MPMKMELIEDSETSAISIVTPGNYPKENILRVHIADSSIMQLCNSENGPQRCISMATINALHLHADQQQEKGMALLCFHGNNG